MGVVWCCLLKHSSPPIGQYCAFKAEFFLQLFQLLKVQFLIKSLAVGKQLIADDSLPTSPILAVNICNYFIFVLTSLKILKYFLQFFPSAYEIVYFTLNKFTCFATYVLLKVITKSANSQRQLSLLLVASQTLLLRKPPFDSSH